MRFSYRITAAVLFASCWVVLDAEPASADVISQTGCGYSSGTALTGGYGGTSWHCTSIDGFGTTTITASAIAEDESPWSANGLYSIGDSASIDAMGYTSGPVRNGFLELSASSGGEFGTASEAVGSWACSGPGFPCYSSANQFLPITLGVPFDFEIVVSYGGETGLAQGNIRFSLFEAVPDYPGTELFPGAAVTVLAAPAAPEPGTLLLLAAGAGILCIKRLCRGKSASVHST